MKIGLFDSGVGGLTVLKEFVKQMPENDYIYFGDTKRVPYGSKSEDTIKKFSKQIVDFLIEKDVEYIVVACGTVSAVALDYLNETYPQIPVKGVIEPTSRFFKDKETSCKIGILGTKTTINSGRWEKEIKKSNRFITYSRACPLFVPLVEEGITQGIIVEEIIKMYLNNFKKLKIEYIVLGCTHYPLLSNGISKYFGEKVKLINPGEETAKHIKEIIHNQNKRKDEKEKKGKLEIYLSDINKHSLDLANMILGVNVKYINLHKFID